MIHGRKESGYFVTTDGDGHKIEGETRQCIHCQYIWEYGPRTSKQELATRGYCLKCQGFICCQTDCIAKFGLAPNCTTFQEEVWRLKDKLYAGVPIPEIGDYAMTQDGIIVRK